MNTIQFNPALNSVAANSLIGNNTSTQANAAANGDFMAMFMQMLTGSDNPTDALTGLGIGDSSDSENPLDTNSAAMEMAAGLLSGNYGFDWLLSGGMESNELSYSGMSGITSGTSDLLGLMGNGNLGLSGMTQLTGNTDITSLLGSSGQSNAFEEIMGSENTGSKLLSQMMLLQNAQSVLNAYNNSNVSAVSQGQVDQAMQVTQNAVPAEQILQSVAGNTATVLPQYSVNANRIELNNSNIAVQTDQNIDKIQNISVKTAENDESSADMLYNGDMGFKTAVAKAQKMMKEPTQNTEQETFNVDAAATNVSQLSSASTDKVSIGVEKVDTIDLDDLTQQISAGISKGELTDKKEISVKLRPEGLGDVTIKLIKEANQIKISIVAASEQTTKLLNDSLPTLRQTMKLAGTEVDEVVVTRQDDPTQQNGFGNQMFMGQQNEHQTASHSGTAQRGGGYYSDNTADDFSAEQQTNPKLVQSGMRIYA